MTFFLQQGRSQYVVVYNNAQAATYAKEKLHGFEYPPGQRLIVKHDYVNSEANRNIASVPIPNSVANTVQYPGYYYFHFFSLYSISFN